MKRGLMMLMCLFCIGQVYAQSRSGFFLTGEGKLFYWPVIKQYNLTLPAFNYNLYIPEYKPEIQPINFEVEELPTSTVVDRPMDMQILSAAYSPFFNIYAPMLRRVSPMAFDFNEIEIVPLSEKLSSVASGWQYTWPGAGGLTMFSSGMAWQSGNMTLTGSGFAGHFYTPFNLSPEYLVGANVTVRYDINNRLAVRAWGQYAHYFHDERDNPHLQLNPFLNKTSVGGAMEYKFNDNFGVGMGIDYRHNPRTGNFSPQYMFYPVFKTKSGIQIRVH